MEFRVLDFEKVTHHYKRYQDGIQKIEDYKNEVLKKVEPIRKEMQNIISAAQSGIVVDSLNEQQRAHKFQSLQQDLVSIDKDAKSEIGKMRDEMTKEVYSELEKMVTDWCESNKINIVIGKLEVVYVSDEYNITDKVLDILKEKDEYVEEEDTVEYKEDIERQKKLENQPPKFLIKETE
jgi:Skp family chaperone for outer membrane proteins